MCIRDSINAEYMGSQVLPSQFQMEAEKKVEGIVTEEAGPPQKIGKYHSLFARQHMHYFSSDDCPLPTNSENLESEDFHLSEVKPSATKLLMTAFLTAAPSEKETVIQAKSFPQQKKVTPFWESGLQKIRCKINNICSFHSIS
eukprot:TRINITY_DN1374_c0_g2_i4.p2 TRINITY_DN1374_c0_g2~~TRINITY_DN1374_c0_g2_i4.p2  ORF type:complete len:143 (-),score=21.15 TRINITY_DN1374_c0_g2_i4:61-489(-)